MDEWHSNLSEGQVNELSWKLNTLKEVKSARTKDRHLEMRDVFILGLLNLVPVIVLIS